MSFRLTPEVVAFIDTQAKVHDLTRTHVVRAVFAAALTDEDGRARVQERLRNFAKANRAMDLPADLSLAPRAPKEPKAPAVRRPAPQAPVAVYIGDPDEDLDLDDPFADPWAGQDADTA